MFSTQAIISTIELLLAQKLLFEHELLTLGAHAHSEGYSSCRVCVYVCVYVCMCVCTCVCVCVTTHNCRLTHWNHKTEIPTCSQQYSDRLKFCRFS